MNDHDPQLDQVLTKLSAARARLIMDKPFLGALVLRLPLVNANQAWCKTTATDARKFYFNAQYIQALNADETQFVLAHEALHCALGHFARRMHRNKLHWDIASDYAVNPILKMEGLCFPPGTLYEPSFEGMSAEEIYPYIQDLPNESGATAEQAAQTGEHAKTDTADTPTSGQDGKSADQASQGAHQPPPLQPQEMDDLSVQWQQRLAGAAQLAAQAGKLSKNMARLLNYLLQPQLPWRQLLARYMTSTARDDYSYTRPSNRRGDPAIFPSLRSAQINIVIAIDVSGSIGDAELGEFLSEVNAIKAQIRARVSLQACDADIAQDGPWIFEPWEEVRLPRKFNGGGGTRFEPIFAWAQQMDQCPDLLIYFTDAQGTFPHTVPHFPVLWLVKGKAMVPWGVRIQLN